MGSSSDSFDAYWVFTAALCGILFLIFDATRHFIQQLGPVRLRRLSGDAELGGGRAWTRYSAQNVHLVSGALLQIALIGAVAATVLVFDEYSRGRAVVLAGLIWAAILVVWKMVLALVPDEIAEVALRAVSPLTHFMYYLFWPVLFPLRRALARLDKAAEEAEEGEEVSDEQVQAYIDVGEEEGILEESEGKLLQQIVDFGDRMARELMTPRIDVAAFDANRPMEELARMFSESKYSRIPIYQNSIDTITGFVHIKEIFDAILRHEPKPVSELARPPYFVSESKKVSELLREFQSEHIQVAVVVDEFGGTAGIITIEDIIEDIVGEIADEHEEEEVTIVDIGDGNFLVSGLLRVEMLEETLHAELAGDDYETVAGLIFTSLGRVPSAGAVIVKNGYRFVVERADRRRIYRVRVSKEPELAEEEEGAE